MTFFSRGRDFLPLCRSEEVENDPETRRSRRFLLRAIAVAMPLLLPLAVCQVASAQPTPGQIWQTVHPGPGDLEMVNERAQSLRDGPAAPRALDWRNPRTGNHGTISLVRVFTRETRQCRQIEYRFQEREADRPDVSTLLWCKQPNGRWMIET
jgi:hypothetical protein